MLYHQLALPDKSKLKAIKALWTSKPWGMLLDNASDTLSEEDYSLLVCDPLIKLQLSNNKLQAEGFALPQDAGNDPFQAMKVILNRFAKQSDAEYPFCGGFVGYLGYDLARILEHLPRISEKDLNLPDFAMGFYPLTILIDHPKQLLLIVGLSGFQQQADELLKQCRNCKQPAKPGFRLESNWQANMSKAEYFDKFNSVKEYILAGDCYQVNLAQRWQAKCSGDPYLAYEQLSQANKAPYSAFIRLENQTILSLSPERFLAVNQRNCETKPIKGTRPRNTDPVKDNILSMELVNSAKDRAENVMIVDLLRNDFSKVCQPFSVKVPELCKLESFEAVHHLVSTVTGRLAHGFENTDLLKACFPGGSITGAPKIRAMQIIEELEPHRRSVYCGSIGYLSCNGNMDSSISIRTLVCEDHTLYCWAGGGLVVDSEAEAEYQETFQKVSQVLPILQVSNREGSCS